MSKSGCIETPNTNDSQAFVVISVIIPPFALSGPTSTKAVKVFNLYGGNIILSSYPLGIAILLESSGTRNKAVF